MDLLRLLSKVTTSVCPPHLSLLVEVNLWIDAYVVYVRTSIYEVGTSLPVFYPHALISTRYGII